MLRKIGDYIVYRIFLFFMFLGKVAPMEPFFAAAKPLAKIGLFFIPGYKKIALRNLEIAFGDKLTPADRERICQEALYHLVMSGIEFLFAKRIAVNWQKHFTFEGDEIIDRHVKNKEAHFVFGGHLGGWTMLEMLTRRWQPDGFKGATVMRKYPNPYIDKFLHDLAQSYGSEFLATSNTGKRLEQLIKQGAMVGFMMDQESRRGQGIQVDFFGLPAFSHVVPAYLAWKHHLPVYPFWYIRERPGHFHVIYRKPIEMSYTGNKEHDIRVITQNMTKELERTISEYPEQWLWFHNRWKRTIGEDKKERKDRGKIKVDKSKYMTSAQLIEQMEKEIGEKKNEGTASNT